jgi:hypothetical protein
MPGDGQLPINGEIVYLILAISYALRPLDRERYRMDAMRTRDSETLDSFVEYCHAHPDQRFWQALRNWSGWQHVLVSNDSDFVLNQVTTGRIQDTFDWEGIKRVSVKAEAFHLTTDELLKRMPKEQAITFVQGALRRMEESLNVPDIPAAKTRLGKVLEELKRS